MKKSFLALFLLAGTFSSFSQSPGFRYGGHFGIGTSDFKKIPAINSTSNLSLNFGFGANKQFTQFLGLDMNVLIAQKGAEVRGAVHEQGGLFTPDRTYAYTDEYRLYYTEIPLMLKLSAGFNNLYLKGFAGPSFNFHLYDDQARSFDDPDYDSRYGFNQKLKGTEVLEFAVVYGAGLDVETKSNNIYYLDFRVSRALNAFNRIDGIAAYNNYFSIGIGYLYNYE
jgi:hypothetical protein